MSLRRPWRLALVVCVCALAARPAAAQAPRAMTLVDLVDVPRVFDPQLAPDGRQVLYVQSTTDWKANRRMTHVWRVRTDGTGAQQLTAGDTGEFSPRWSPDGRSIAFVARRGDNGAPQIYLLDPTGGEARQASTHATGVSTPTWAPDGKAIYFLAADPKTADERDRDRVRDDVYAYDENEAPRHLWALDVATGAETRLTAGAFAVLDYHPSADGRRVALLRGPSTGAEDAWRAEAWVMNADGAHATAVTHNGIAETSVRLSPDGTRLLFLAFADSRLERYLIPLLFMVPASGGTPVQVLPDVPYEILRADWSRDGTSIFYVANMGLRSELFQVDVATHRSTRLTSGDHSLQGWSYVAAADRHVFQIDERTRFGEVWTLAGGASAPVQASHVFDALDRDFRIPRQERVEWKGRDGVAIDGLLFYPLDYTPGTRYPLVVQVHGGPHDSDKFGWNGGITGYVQVLTAMGYAVLKPNHRGSSGYGTAFLGDMIGGYFRNAHLDVLAGVDHLVRTGLADPDRLAIMGWSAGGHMTNKLVTMTDRFKAASAGAGGANFVSLYGQSDDRTSRAIWFGGSLWQKDAPIETYWNQSPLRDVTNVKTPMLFFVGEQDVRVPMLQSVEMFHAVKSLGVPTHLYAAPREGHNWGELRHTLFKMNAELEWFEKYAMHRTYTWERAPGDAPARPPAAKPTSDR